MIVHRNNQIFLLYMITFIDLFAVGLIVPLISNHVIKLGGTHFISGLMGSTYAGLQLFSGPIIGSLSDFQGRKPVLFCSLLFCSIFYLCFGVITSIYLLLLIRMILGVFKHTQTLCKALVADLVNDDSHSEIFGKMAAISGAGITVGPLLGGHILEDNPDNGFSIVCLLTFFSFIFNAFLVHKIVIHQIHNKEFQSKLTEKNSRTNDYFQLIFNSWKNITEELKSVNWHDYWNVFLLKGLVGFSMSIFYSNYSPLLKIHYNLSPKWIGYTISFQGIIGSLCSFFIKYINKIYNKDPNYTLRNLHSFIILFLSFTGFLIFNQWKIFLVLLIPLAIANAVLRLTTLEIVIKKSPENQRGSLIGASNSVRSISGIIGPFIAGLLNDIIGVKYTLIVSLLSAGVGIILAKIHKDTERKNNLGKKIT